MKGTTTIIAHLGYPTDGFVAPLIYNPWFASKHIDAAVVPMGVKSEDYPTVLRALFRVTNIRGALVTMPHKVTTLTLVDALTPAARTAGACNAILRRGDGSLLGDQFDGLGFVRALHRKGRQTRGARALVIGSGGVGSAIASSLAESGLAELSLFDAAEAVSRSLADRLQTSYPALSIRTGSADPAGFDLVVNATPLGTKPDDPLPIDPTRITSGTLVGDVVMARTATPLLKAAAAKGCPIQAGTEMLFEMIPAYLEFFGFGTASPEELRAVAALAPMGGSHPSEP